MNIDTIKTFKNYLCNLITKINNNIKFRSNRKIGFKDIIYYASLIIGNNDSYDIVNSKLKICNILDVSKNALIKQKNNLEYKYINQLNNGLLAHIYDSNKNKNYRSRWNLYYIIKSS